MSKAARLLACFVAIALSAVAALAESEIYEWTDERGVAHYTDDLELVPEPFRDGAKVTTATERDGLQRVIERRVPAAPVPAAPPVDAIDGIPEAQWRAEAARLDALIAELAPRAEACEGDHVNRSPGDGSRKRKAERDEAEACAKVRAELADAVREREAFSELAHRAGVPPGWVRGGD
jgi:hypothetical protein